MTQCNCSSEGGPHHEGCSIFKRPRHLIRLEYLSRRTAYHNMVGRLYPQRIYEEIVALAEEYGEPNDLPVTLPPTPAGYSNWSP